MPKIKYPVKLIYKPNHLGIDSPVYELEVFGVLEIGMVVFRRNAFWIGKDVGKVEMLPKDEFLLRFVMYEGVETVV